MVALRKTEEVGGEIREVLFSEPALDYAEKLAEEATRLASTDPLPSPSRVLETLRSVPAGIPALRDDRLVRLAAAAARVAVSPRLELYPKNLDALRALKLAQSAVAGVSRINSADLRTRVRDRYPEAQPLPDHPDLDSLIRAAGLDLEWDEPQAAYLAPPPPGFASSTSLHRFQTIVHPGATPTPTSFVPPLDLPREVEEAFEFERRLQAAYRAPSYLVLATEPRLKYLEIARHNLAKHFPMPLFHCEREFLSALRQEAESKRVRWEVVLRADATKPEAHASGIRDWENLRKLAGSAAGRVSEQIRSRSQSLLLIYPGLLARYGQLGILEELADSLGAHSLWLLAGSEHQAASPMVDGQAIPARPTQWAWIPPKWLDNDFRNLKGGKIA